MKFSLASALLLAPLAVAASGPEQRPSERPKMGMPTSQGCFKANVGFPDHVGSIDKKMLSNGQCNQACREMKKAVAATDSSGCHCGDEYPPEGDRTADSDCDLPCNAYPLEACGGKKAYSVWNTGIKLQVAHMKGDGDSSSSSSGSSSTASGETSTRTRTVTRSITSGASQATTDASSTVTETQTETETKLATATVSEGTSSTSASAASATTSGESAGSRTVVGAGVAMLAAIVAF